MSSSVTLMTTSMPARKARAVNCTDSSFDSVVPTVTEPVADEGSATGRAAISTVTGGRSDGVIHNSVELAFFGAGNDDTTFDVRVFGWFLAQNPGAAKDLWVPKILAGFSCTLSTAVGVAGAVAVATDRFADTITRMTGLGTDLSSEIVSPANNTPGHVVVDLKGCHKFELSFDMTGATSANALYKLI